MAVDRTSGKIICTAFCNGKKHDIRLLRESKTRMKKETELLVDSGYQGAQKDHKNTVLPTKKTKGKKLSKEDKKANRELSSKRVVNEHVIGKLKRFHIIADRYRNRRKRFALRFNLIAGIYNFELNS